MSKLTRRGFLQGMLAVAAGCGAVQNPHNVLQEYMLRINDLMEMHEGGRVLDPRNAQHDSSMMKDLFQQDGHTFGYEFYGDFSRIGIGRKLNDYRIQADEIFLSGNWAEGLSTAETPDTLVRRVHDHRILSFGTTVLELMVEKVKKTSVPEHTIWVYRNEKQSFLDYINSI